MVLVVVNYIALTHKDAEKMLSRYVNPQVYIYISIGLNLRVWRSNLSVEMPHPLLFSSRLVAILNLTESATLRGRDR